MFAKPRAKADYLEPERLVFDPRLQMRFGLPTDPAEFDAAVRGACWRTECGPNGRPIKGRDAVCVADPRTVADLAELLESDPDFRFDPLEVVRAPGPARDSQPVLWVFGGFTRGAAYVLNGRCAAVPCNVYEGTFPDALFYALSENHKNVQTRGAGSARKSVETLIDSPALMERVRDRVKHYGTLLRAIAAACQVGVNTVDRTLADRGLGVAGLKLAPRQTKTSNTRPTQSPVGIVSDQVQNVANPVSVGGEVIGHVPDEPLYTAQIDTSPLPPDEPDEPEEDIEPDDPELAEEVAPRDEPTPAVVTAPQSVVILPAPAPAQSAPLDPAAAFRARLEVARAGADEVIRLAGELDEAFRRLIGTACGPALDRITFAGQPLIVKRTVREKRGGATVQRLESCASAHPAALAAAVRRIRPKAVCAACHGTGCVGCRMLGYVPDDESLIRDDKQQAFDCGNPWDGDADLGGKEP